MELGTILDFDSCPLYVPTSSHVDHVGSAKVILAHVFTHPPSEALAVNETAALEQQVLTIHELPHRDGVRGEGILFLGEKYCAIDCYGNVGDIGKELSRHH